MAKSSTGLEENVAGLLCYVVGWITGLIFFLIEKDSKFVKFHGMQSIITFGGLMIVSWILANIPVIGWIIGLLLSVLAFVLWIVLMIKAYQGQKYKLPGIGDLAEKWSS
ncbi:MAG: DUF4870 domain-containing protein [Dehalococcoidia bacterium]|nr:DUF4870 domain-containing protein [Dehalococcoidia bacterium]